MSLLRWFFPGLGQPFSERTCPWREIWRACCFGAVLAVLQLVIKAMIR